MSDEAFRNPSGTPLQLALGKDITGKPYVADLGRMLHLLVAGTTGSGKSVSVNAMVLSLLYRLTPAEVRLLMIDPKVTELGVYDGIPHLLLPVVSDMKKAALALRWAVDEMERRYQMFANLAVRNLSSYNKRVGAILRGEAPAPQKQVLVVCKNEDGSEVEMGADEAEAQLEPLPYIVVVIDELADLMVVAARDVEGAIQRLAQKARAAGMHLLVATQRPSVDVITGIIKANFPARTAFRVSAKVDSRTILDQNGAENLLGAGDMLVLAPGTSTLDRVHGAFVSDDEVKRVVDFLRSQGEPLYDEDILKPRADEGAPTEEEEHDPEENAMYDQAVALVAEMRYASVSMIQRRLRIGYNHAARLVERMEKEGVVGPSQGGKPREVLVRPAE